MNKHQTAPTTQECSCGCASEHGAGAEGAATGISQPASPNQTTASQQACPTQTGCSCGDTHNHIHNQQPTATASACGHDHAHDQADDGCGCGHDHSHSGLAETRQKWFLGIAITLFIIGIFWGEQKGWPAFLGAYLLAGGPVLWQCVRNIRQRRFFDENSLMSIASLGAWAVGANLEAAAVMLLYRIGEAIQASAVLRSRKAISALTDIRPETARLLAADGSTSEIAPENVQPGQHLQVRPGERLPVDGLVVSGRAHLDFSALTGESLPQAVAEGTEVKAGAINQDGLLVIEATRAYHDSAVARILRLLDESSAHKAPIESMISSFARRYTPLVTLAALLLFLIPVLAGGYWQTWLYRALVFLAASCPCALIISVPLTYYAGLGAAAKVGALIKGGNYLSALPQVTTVVFDKTGTLTEGRFRVSGIQTTGAFTAEQLLDLAAQAESASNHPLAQAVCAAYTAQHGTPPPIATELHEEAGMGIRALVSGHTVLVGNARLLQTHGITLSNDQAETALFIAVDGIYAGSISVEDSVKPSAAAAIRELKELGVQKTVLLSGDTPAHAERIAQELGLDEARGGLMPEDKVNRLQELLAARNPQEKLLFMGDGINDAPSLALADIGVAMGGLGAEAATAAADLVLLQDDPQQLVQAMRIAKRTNRIARQNIVFSLAVKLGVLVLAAFGWAGMLAAVFADVGVALLAVANGMRAMRQPKENRQQQEQAKLRALPAHPS